MAQAPPTDERSLRRRLGIPDDARRVMVFAESSHWDPDWLYTSVALRNATHERAWGLLPIPATPATGHERTSCAFDYCLAFTPAGDWRENGVPLLAQDMLASPWDVSAGRLRALAASLVAVDRPDVVVGAIKPAWRGEGLIVRLATYTAAGASVVLAAPGRTLQAAALCDARERDLEPLPVEGEAVRLTMPGNIASVRLVFSS